jgi:hypothetical protein
VKFIQEWEGCRIAVEYIALSVGSEERLVFVLTMEIDQLVADCRENADGQE